MSPMSTSPFWDGFGLASLIFAIVSLLTGFTTAILGWTAIHPLLWLPISAILTLAIALPYLHLKKKQDRPESHE